MGDEEETCRNDQGSESTARFLMSLTVAYIAVITAVIATTTDCVLASASSFAARVIAC